MTGTSREQLVDILLRMKSNLRFGLLIEHTITEDRRNKTKSMNGIEIFGDKAIVIEVAPNNSIVLIRPPLLEKSGLCVLSIVLAT